MMNIPEAVALQGVDVVQEYKFKQEQLNELKNKIFKTSNELESIENRIKELLNENLWLSPTPYFKKWKERGVLKHHLVLSSLTKEHEDLSFQYIDFDNEYTSLNLELCQKGWLPDWQMATYEKMDT